MLRHENVVVVVTYQSVAFVDDCLRALRDQTMDPGRYAVVVVDNASTDGTADLVAARHPEVRLVRSPSNLGFAGGCHAGLAGIECDVVVLVNSDAFVSREFLEEITAPLTDPRVGAVTGHIVLDGAFVAHGAGPSLRARAGRTWYPARDGGEVGAVTLVNSTGNELTREGYGYDRSYLDVDETILEPAPADVFGLCAAAAAVRGSALSEVGGLDERYFLYYEDTDLSWRLQLAGWRIVYAPRARARHRHQGSVGRGSSVHAYHDERNRLLTLAKNARAGLALRAWTRHPLTTLSLTARGPRNWARTAVRVRALLGAARLLPGTLALRRLARRDRPQARVVDALVDRAPSASDLV